MPTLPEGLTPEAYEAAWDADLDVPLTGLDTAARRQVFYRRYNRERADRVRASYEVSAKLRAAVESIAAPQRWIVLTESWCVDSAYSLPVIAAAAALADDVTLRILPRDAHPDVMDRYLTNGSRSIPKLVALGADGEELFTWGPRPEAARRLREEILAAGGEPRQASARLIEWWDDEGWVAVDHELAALLAAVTAETATS